MATACLYRDFRILAETAALLGREQDAAHFAQLAERTRTAFNDHYVSDDGTIRSDAQTVYALAIVFGLLEEEASAAGGPAPGRTGGRERPPDSDRVRGHPVRFGRLDVPQGIWMRPIGCCCNVSAHPGSTPS